MSDLFDQLDSLENRIGDLERYNNAYDVSPDLWRATLGDNIVFFAQLDGSPYTTGENIYAGGIFGNYMAANTRDAANPAAAEAVVAGLYASADPADRHDFTLDNILVIPDGQQWVIGGDLGANLPTFVDELKASAGYGGFIASGPTMIRNTNAKAVKILSGGWASRYIDTLGKPNHSYRFYGGGGGDAAQIYYPYDPAHSITGDLSICITFLPEEIPTSSNVRVAHKGGFNEWVIILESGRITWSTFVSSVRQYTETPILNTILPEYSQLRLVCTRRESDGRQEIYMNGIRLASVTTTSGSIDTSTDSIAMGSIGGYEGMRGRIDEMLILDKTLNWYEAMAYTRLIG